jgi:hypothetical protein
MQNAKLCPLPESGLGGLAGRFPRGCCDVVTGLRSQLEAGEFVALPGPLSGLIDCGRDGIIGSRSDWARGEGLARLRSQPKADEFPALSRLLGSQIGCGRRHGSD